MTGAAPKLFDFATVFDDTGDIAYQPPTIRRSYSADEVERIRSEALAEGERSGLAQAERDVADALADIAAATRASLSALASVAHDHRVGSAGLAMAAARRIADAALNRFPDAPVTAALEALAREVEAQPRLVVRVAEGLEGRVQAALNQTAEAIGHEGRITVRADPSLPTAAFVLDWGDGKAAFDPAAAADRVAAALDEALVAEGQHAEPLIPASEADHG
ncbi:MAG: flagellar assembly protein FliH [Caulobacter sp.]|nr:flagellar assembly protein FliH [Caulobacter sp.]